MATKTSRSARVLAALSTLLLVVAIGFGAILLAGVLFGFGLGDTEVVHSQIDPELVADLPENVIATSDLRFSVLLDDATGEQHRWAAARDLASVIVVIVAAWLLRGLLGSVRDGDPFTEANVRRLRGLAVVVLVGIPIASVVSSFFAAELADTAGLDGTEPSLNGNAVLGGLALFALGEVFAAGVRLRDDVEGTI